MEVDGPPRMVGWITWSGRERSSQTQFLPVPGVRLIHLSLEKFPKSSLRYAAANIGIVLIR